MKKILLGAVLAGSVSSFATNGVNLIGMTPHSRAMGGTGVGVPANPVESIIKNPALIGTMEGDFYTEFGGTLFLPTVKVKMGGGAISETSKANQFLIPEFGIVNRINDNLTFGIGAFGVSGLGVDYRNTQVRQRTYFQLMKIIPSVAYKVNEMISIGAGIHTALGMLDMGQGNSQSLGFGVQVGASLNFGDFIYAGLSYQSPIAMTYKEVFNSNPSNQQPPPPGTDDKNEDMKMTQPQEIALGIGAKPLDGLTVGLDLRWINWAGATGFKDFKWKDQIVFALGAEYFVTKQVALRVGYNFGQSPVKGVDGACTNPSTCPNDIPDLVAKFPDYSVYQLNAVGFPAIAEQHITIGVGYKATKRFGVDLAFVRALDSKIKVTPDNPSPLTPDVETTMSQNSLSFALNWEF